MPAFDSSVRALLQQSLLRWFRRTARDLPWRRKRTPYRVWLAEVMLQQTRVEQARDYYIRFLKRFPTIRSLAVAPQRDVLKHWEGLGYYTRARNLHAAAQKIMREHGGRFPREPDAIRALPGVGAYTAAAVGSLAFGHDAAAVDGNVLRAISRLVALESDITKPSARAQVQALADELLPSGRAGAFNEAVMELGARICTPRKPKCARCPWRPWCAAAVSGDPERYPVKARKRKVPHKHVGAGLVVDRRGRFLIAQRLEDSMLGGLWEFPGGKQEPGETMEQCIARELREELAIVVSVGAHALTVSHAFSHFTMDLHAYFARVVQGRPRAVHCADWRWVTLAEMDEFAFGRADQRIIEFLRALPRTGQNWK
ncbi:MAG: A/G-specific adenine glycosylase [Verrucomicrobia bacterium]|nr:A/G-specific adenine glycosylase [Kiritimatiellia bacterium]MCO6401305.1 A/G-specific adenine glycosylase [Verrucomicrobiota bacterium]